VAPDDFEQEDQDENPLIQLLPPLPNPPTGETP
jgi:hypothetical protein